MAERKSGWAAPSKLVRRTCLSNDPALMGEIKGIIDSKGWAAAVDHIVDKPLDTSSVPHKSTDESKERNGYVIWYLEKVNSPKNALQEKMTFFWHGILTSDFSSAGGKRASMLAKQINLFRSKSLTNYRDLLQAFVIDGALVRYLNANTNTLKKPNENLSRELMELFTTGIGPYTETDIREAAKAMSGWGLTQNNEAIYRPDNGYSGTTTFMGETKNWDIKAITERLLNHQATADRISGFLWYDLVGDKNPPSTLGSEWMSQNYDIKWLLKRILKDERFKDGNHYARTRSGFEYYANVRRVLRLGPEIYRSQNVGQSPWKPPNVAGWPSGDRWIDAGSLLSRTQLLNTDYKKFNPESKEVSVDDVLDDCGIFDVSDSTLQVMNSLNNDDNKFDVAGLTQLRYRVALSSPEANLL